MSAAADLTEHRTLPYPKQEDQIKVRMSYMSIVSYTMSHLIHESQAIKGEYHTQYHILYMKVNLLQESIIHNVTSQT